MSLDGAKNAEEHGSRLPPHTAARLYGGGSWKLPGEDSEPCEGSAHHSPRPLFTQPTRLVLERWFTTIPHGKQMWLLAPDAWLCGTCRDNLNILLQMTYAAGGDLEWEIRREFGNTIRALATKGWEWFVEHRPKGV